MLVNSTGVYTTKGGLKAIVESLNPATGYIVREDGSHTRHIWQSTGRHGVGTRSSQLELVKYGYQEIPDDKVGGFTATCRRIDGTTFQTRALPSIPELVQFLNTQGWYHMVVRCDEVRSVGQVDLVTYFNQQHAA